MLDDLKFVQGAIAKKDMLPALTHFVMDRGTVRGFNGTLALCSKVAFDLSCKPKADTLIRAINNCSDTVQLSLTKAGRLSVVSGSFKAFVDCVDGETPHVMPEGKFCPVDGVALLDGLKAVAPFVGDDASRPWANGVLLKGPSMFATNNVTLVEYWAGETLPEPVNLPRMAVRELLRINQPPTDAQFNDNSVTFHFEGGRWLRTQLFPADWPDLSKVLDQPHNAQPVDARLFDGLAVVKPFADKMNRVYFRSDGVHTHTVEGEGASYGLDNFAVEGVYNIDMLELLQGVAQRADFTTFPKPCLFFGDKLRGAIIGMRQ